MPTEMKMKDIIVLGATGSVGTQALDVAEKEGHKVKAISANRDVDAVYEYALKFEVEACAMADENAADMLKARFSGKNIRVYSGPDGVCRMIKDVEFDTAVNSILGMAGLMPSYTVIEKGCRLALANKESMVIAGEILNDLAKSTGSEILPVDSEHCAIHQCLKPGKKSEVSRLIITASGGPFFGKTREELEEVTLEETLDHPTWKMGAKITVDSATLMNKGFEVIEACRLFDVVPENVEVLVHRQSIVHSMVEFCDNSVMAQLSVPDMRFCVQYAVNYPERSEAITPKLDLASSKPLTFAHPDMNAFPLLKCAYDAVKVGGALPCVLNAANEVAVAAFLAKKIRYIDIERIVISTVEYYSDSAAKAKTINEITGFDPLAREYAKALI